MITNIKIDDDIYPEECVVEFGAIMENALRDCMGSDQRIPILIDRTNEPLFVQGNSDLTLFFSQLFQTVWYNDGHRNIFVTVRSDHDHIIVTIKNGVDLSNIFDDGFIERGLENGCDIEISSYSNGCSYLRISLERWKIYSQMWY